MATAVSDQSGGPLVRQLVGRTFLHPALDYLLIGGVASLLLTVVVLAQGTAELVGIGVIHTFVLFSNSAHFASSTVRLYKKPGAFETWPTLTKVVPLLTLLLLVGAMAFASHLGRHVSAIYLTWSPYHYAAQAYGLAVMYSYRSGCKLTHSDKRALFAVALLPFLHAVLTGRGVGLHWLLPESVRATAGFASFVAGAKVVVPLVALIAIAAVLVKIWRSTRRPLPLISLLAIVSNGVWFFVLGPLEAFYWATIAHGLQYLVIVCIFHVRDQVQRPDNARPGWQHALGFYGASLGLGYLLFQCLPLGFIAAGFGPVESVVMTVAAINIHHFVVDGFIWKIRKDKSNRQIVDGQAVPAT